MSNPLRIGTRGSPLALAQAHQTRARLAAAHAALAAPDAIEIVVIKTTGDRIQDRTLMEAGGKGLFTKEIEEALAAGSIDLAVHSMKDVPTWLPDGLEIRCLLPREDPRDAFFSEIAGHLDDLPEGAVVGTASLRRQAQVLSRRPDLKVVPIRGNVETRLRKLAAREVDATMLALAGLRRLDMTDRITAVLETDIMLPAVAQGAIGIETRADDDVTNGLLAALNCERDIHPRLGGAGAAGRPRRLLPHPDRGAGPAGRGRQPDAGGAGRRPRRQPRAADRPQRCRRRCRGAGARCGRGAEKPDAAGLLRAVTGSAP